jgi:hypothetical protein
MVIPYAKTSLAVSSSEFCQCSFNESYIREGMGSGGGHKAMIPLHQVIPFLQSFREKNSDPALVKHQCRV